MNKAFLAVGVVLMALLGFYSISVVTGQQNGAELDYYLLKETTEAAMNDAVDTSFYRKMGMLRMDKEKFMESFVKRFAVNVDNSRDYTIEVYDINETPPKVSVKISSERSTKVINKIDPSTEQKANITTTADMILEDKNKTNAAIENQNKKYIKDLKSAGLTISSTNNIK